MKIIKRRNNSLILNVKIREYKRKFEFYLKNYINKLSKEHNGILESMEYTLMAPCKRLRAIIMIAFMNFLTERMMRYISLQLLWK